MPPFIIQVALRADTEGLAELYEAGAAFDEGQLPPDDAQTRIVRALRKTLRADPAARALAANLATHPYLGTQPIRLLISIADASDQGEPIDDEDQEALHSP